MVMPGKPASLRARALQWLSQREHSRLELRAKLLRIRRDGEAPGPTEEEVEAVVEWLAAQGHLSDARFVESRVHARQHRFGNLRIRQELQQHGLALDADAQQALKASEFERAREVWVRKFGEPAGDASGRARQMRFLAGRGFSADVIRHVVRGGADDDPA
jgi:regulatory protein